MTVSNDGEPNQSSSDEEKYLHYGQMLRSAVESTFEPWLRRVVEARGEGPLPKEIDAAVKVAKEMAIANITRLIEADVTDPLSGPLEQLRQAVSGLAPILDAHGFARPTRDPYDQEMRPDDVYGLGPLSFMDLGESVQAAGIAWGAAKAHLHMKRRDATGS